MLSVMDNTDRPRKTRNTFTKTSYNTRENEDIVDTKKTNNNSS